MVPITHEQNVICSKARLDSTTLEQTIICRQCGPLAYKREQNTASNGNVYSLPREIAVRKIRLFLKNSILPSTNVWGFAW